MVVATKLTAVMADFARTVITDFPLQGILDELVKRMVDVLAVTGAGVTLISPGEAPHLVAASDPRALDFERLQTRLNQGPCITAYEGGEAVQVADLEHDDRYPEFAEAALSQGLRAVFTFPLRDGDGRLGALDLYRDEPGELSTEDLDAAQTLADVAAAYLLNAQARARALAVSDRFRENALHDPLTGLPNRALLQERVEHAQLRAQRSRKTLAVLFADLDHFKRVNDTYGHEVGDALLVAVGRRLSSLIRPGDTLARVSGDEFVVLCEDLAGVEEAELLAQRIAEAFMQRFVVGGVEVVISASVGISHTGRPGAGDGLLADADGAMYEAKRRGGGTHQVVGAPAPAAPRDGRRLEVDLRAAVGGRDLDLAYQPVVRTADGMVRGVEALLRWTHPVWGAVPALTAVGLAERDGSIGELGCWVLERSCADRVQWAQDHPGRLLDLYVNVSAYQVMAEDFALTVGRVLDETRMDPGSLVLEVTEGVFLQDVDRARERLADLRALGLRIALDDFGTGYSSLHYLQRFPVDVVKIDGQFVADLGRDAPGAVIVRAVSDLAHALGLSVTAEGVETLRQRDELRVLGCEQAQGFLFAHPLARAGINALLGGDPDAPLRLPHGALPYPTVAEGTSELPIPRLSAAP